MRIKNFTETQKIERDPYIHEKKLKVHNFEPEYLTFVGQCSGFFMPTDLNKI
jgi:hypothetical protein